MDFETAEVISNLVSAKLDELDPIEHEYVLDVCSPGAERPIRNKEEFLANLNEYISVYLDEEDENKKEYDGGGCVGYNPFDPGATGEITDDMFDFMTRTCVVICEEGKDEEVMLAINELDGGYFAEAPYYSDKEMISMLDMQNTSSLSLAILFSLLLIGCESLLITYYVKLRKNEIMLLERNGLSKRIAGYLGQDDYKMGIIWIILEETPNYRHGFIR